MPARASRPRTNNGSHWLLAIAVFKLIKGALLLIVAIGMLRLLNRDVAATVEHWVQVLRVDPDNRFIHRILLRIFNVTPRQLREFSVGTFLYSGIFLTEGFGLVARRHWAEYMTLISTALFIPIEAYELFVHFTLAKVAITAVNVLIVWYLAARLRR